MIVSGKYVGILDPHRHHISEMKEGGTVEGGKLFTIEEFCTHEGQAALFNNIFGFQKNMEKFNGTLFRFPFRTATSNSRLSNTMYTEDKVTSELYESFQFEAERMLLFLKHVVSIELYVWEDLKPKCTFRVSITEASKRNMIRMHKWAKSILDRPDHTKSTHIAETSLFTCTVEVSHCENMGSDTIAHYTWLVSNTIGCQDADLNEASKELKVAPWVGLATRVPACLNIAHCTFPFTNVTAMFERLVNAVSAYKIENADGMDMREGYVFCFLPLPLAIPGLPVNIHGYFSIDSNRRGIKWPSHDVKGRDAEWNKQLILKLLIPSYAVFIAAKSIWFTYSKVDSLVPIVEAPYTWWPVPNLIQPHPTWKILYPCLPKLLLQLPVFWTFADGGQWIAAKEAIFLSINVSDAIIQMLTQLKLPVIVLPEHIQDSFEEGVEIASFRYICSLLKIKCDRYNVQNVLSNFQLLQEFLIYACGDVESKEFDHLVGLPIIPTATNSPPCFLQRKSSSSPDLLVVGENQDMRGILHGLEDRIVCTEVSADIEALLISMAGTGLFNLTILSRDDVPLYLKESMLTWCFSEEEVTWRPGQDGHPPKEWLSNVWIWITKQEMHPNAPNEMAVVHKVNGLPLIPVYSLDEDHSKQENLLLPLTVKANGCHNLLYCDSTKNNSIVQIVKKLGFRTVEPSKCISDVIAVQPKMASALPMLTPQSLLQSQFLKNAISAVHCKLDGNDRCILRTYLFECLKTDKDIKEVLLKLLRSLPLYSIQPNSLSSKESDHFTAIRDPSMVMFLSPGINPPTAVELPLPVLNYDPKDLDSYNALLGRKPLEVKEFIKDHILSQIARTPDGSSKDIKKSVALWVLEYIEEGDEDVISALCNVQLVTSMNDVPCYARDLVDRTDPEMKLFHGTNETNVFLHSDYDPHLNKIRLLGLQTWDNICATKEIYVAFVTDRANWIASQNRSRGHDLEQISKNIVKKVYTMFKDDFKHSAWNALQTIPFVFCEDTPPNQYVGNWKGYEYKDRPLSPTQLCVPSDRVVASDLPYVVGSVYPLPSAYYEGLLERAGICHEVTFEDALQHIQHVTADTDAWKMVEDVSHTVEKVYSFLQSLMPLERKAKEMTHIWIKEECTFVDFSKIVLDGSVSLIPYRFRISELDKVDKFRSLWKFFGIKEQFLTEDYIAVLHEMQTKGKLDSSSMTTCLNLLTQLQSLTKECYSPDDILLPTVQQQLRNSQDCVYDNRKWISRHPSVCESFAVVHSDVPNDQAIFFGTQSLSTVLGNPQPITLQCRGKKSFLQVIREKMPQFKDTLDVFKELIQNADDAGATEVKFLIDWRQHPTENLFTDEMKHWQGPALYAYNNSVFTDKDFKNICDPGRLCTRRMSVNGEPCTTAGFCSVYHCTDVPMLISGSKLLVFDPHGHYLSELAPNVKNLIGVFFDLEKDGKYLKEYYFDQLKPFDGVFGIESQQMTKGEALDCTIFRLPLRSDQVQDTSLPGRVFDYPDTNFTTEVVKKISLLADRMLLFTSSVVRMEVYEQRSNTMDSIARKILSIRKSSTSPSFGYEISNVRNVIIEWCEDFECTSKINTKTWMMLDQTQTKPFMQEVTLAVPLMKDIDPEYGVPCPLKEGSLSSLLPLGHVSQQLISRNWKFVVNIVGKLRNNLTKYRVHVESAKDVSVLVHQVENTVLEALLSVLSHFASHWSTMTEVHLKCYYSMWIPNDAFLQKVFASKRRLLFTENKTWKPMDDISTVNASLTKEQLGTHVDISDSITHILLKSNFNITKLPPEIACFSRIKSIDFKCFCKEALFPLIHQLQDYSSQEQVEAVVKFVLEGHIEPWLRDDLKTLPCIPTTPSGRLRRPCELVDQSDSTLCSLYSEKDEVFPQGEYLNLSATLHKLGMKRSHLSLECKDIVDRANTILSLSDTSLGRKRCLAILSCLSSHQEKEQMAQMLSSLPFLPVEERPPNSNVPWNCGQQFAAPEHLYLPQVVNLVYSQHSVLSVKAYQQINADDHGLEFKDMPPLNLVLNHFCCLIDWVADQMNDVFDDDADKIAKAVSDIYKFIDKTLRGNEETVRKKLTGRAVVWDGIMKKFVHPIQVSLQVHPIFANTSLNPYWRTSNEIDCLRRHSSLWNCLQVKRTLDLEDAMKILHDIYSAIQTRGEITSAEIEIVIKLLEYFKINNKREGVMLPTEKYQLLPPEDCVFDDRDWSSNARKQNLRDRFEFVHSKVPGDLAQYFNVAPVTTKLAAPKKVTIFKKSGQKESLTRRIKGIIEDYKDNIDVFKELIQNADDAGATEVKFLIDWRQHPTENLFTDEMKPWQGPALYAYNNSVFTDEDFKNICELGGATKKEDPMTIGRFGLGFCATYHLTDVPSFVSRRQLTIFDPHKRYIKDAMEGDSPGLFVDFVSETSDLNDFLRGQVEPYEGVFGCSCLKAEEFNGTLFRFPFRNDTTAQQSEISHEIITEKNSSKLTKGLFDTAEKLLIFLNNLKMVELYEVHQDSSDLSNLKPCLSITKHSVERSGDNLLQLYAESGGRLEQPGPQCITSFYIDVKKPNKEVDSCMWLTSSNLGTGKCLDLAQAKGKMAKGLVPFAEVAVPVKKVNCSEFVPQSVEGQLFCFLPLPINTQLKCLVNGMFKVTKDRRHLVDLDDKSVENSWNAFLIEDVIVRAFINLLQKLAEIVTCPTDFIECYYSMWPFKTSGDALLKILSAEFTNELFTNDYQLIFTEGHNWKSVTEVCVLEKSFEIFEKPLKTSMIKLLLQNDYHVACIPDDILAGVVSFGRCINELTFQSYCCDCFSQCLHNMDDQTRNLQMIGILKHFADQQWIRELLGGLKSIPTKPRGTLVPPDQLIDPCEHLLADLYEECDERFPSDPYQEGDVMKALRLIGMISSYLSEQDVLERASSIQQMPKRHLALKRSQNLTNYLMVSYKKGLFQTVYSNEFRTTLSRIPFLPSEPAPFQKLSCWYQRDQEFIAPQRLYKPKYKPLVFTQAPILGCSDAIELPLQFQSYPSTTDVLCHLKRLVEFVNSHTSSSLEGPVVQFLKKTIHHVYTRLDKDVHDPEVLMSIVDLGPVVWDANSCHFLSIDKVALHLPAGLSCSLCPYRWTSADISCLQEFHSLWHHLRVKRTYSTDDCLNVLSEMKSKGILDQTDIPIVIGILEFLCNSGVKCNVLIPSTNKVLCNPSDTVYDDRKWSQTKERLKERFTFVHEKVTSSMAKFFGVLPLSSKLASPKKVTIFKKSGQKESLTRRIKGIIEDYKDNIDVFKELIQNADDAGATEVKFLIDWRQHPTENLFTDEMKPWQGPALYAYNNSVFTDEDFRNICELGGATKKEDPMTIGRFGLGFCATYHLTDVPSFVSQHQLTIFDPHKCYIKDAMEGDSPGLFVDFVSETSDLNDYLRGQVEPYEGVFGCSCLKAEEFNGTLFRFPFRNDVTAQRSEISHIVFEESQVDELLEAFRQASSTILVFLKNVKHVQLYTLSKPATVCDTVLIGDITRKEVTSPRNLIKEFKATSLPNRYCSQFTIQSSFEGNIPNTEWIVSSAVGCAESLTLAQSQGKGFIPFAEIAVPVKKHNSMLIPDPIKGQLFCFLPLPINTELKCLVNGTFEVTKERRHLKDLMENTAVRSWNKLLIEDAVLLAFIELLSYLCKGYKIVHEAQDKQRILQSYYDIWPLCDARFAAPDPFLSVLEEAFVKYLHHSNEELIVTDTGELKAMANVFMENLQQNYRANTFDSTMIALCKEVMIDDGIPLATLPPRIAKKCVQSSQMIDFRMYCDKHFFRNFTCHKESVRDKHMLFILSKYQQLEDTSDEWLKDTCGAVHCIPTQPKSELVTPSHLVMPDSPVARLYSVEDGRFPTEAYLDETVSRTLLQFGMKKDQLEENDIVERAENVSILPLLHDQKQRSLEIVKYLSSRPHGQINSACRRLNNVPFLPTLSVEFGVEQLCALAAPSEMYLPKHAQLVFTHSVILDRNSALVACPDLFKFKTTPSVDNVVRHLKNIVIYTNSGDSRGQKLDPTNVVRIVTEIYEFLESEVTKDLFFNIMLDEPFIWDNDGGVFIDSIKVAISSPIGLKSLSPYRKTSTDIQCLTKYQDLWKKLGVSQRFTVDDCTTVLEEMSTSVHLEQDNVDLAIQILEYLKQENCAKEYALIPTVSGTLVSPDKCIYDDRQWTTKKQDLRNRFIFTHEKVIESLAKYFGVLPLSSKIAQPKKLKIEARATGQHESLTRRLKGIIEDYKDSIDVFKELIQNADDAGATEVKFLIDWRQHPTEKLFTDEMKHWQGPALYAYNNSVFTDDDFKNICALGGATKKDNPMKIGRFGLGFCTVYRITDLPSFVSRSTLVLFDPHTTNLGDLIANDQPGLEFNFVEQAKDINEYYHDQIAVYQGVFDCDVKKEYPGTLFRFPFRSEAMAGKSEICDEPFCCQDTVTKLVDSLFQYADQILLFLHNLRKVELHINTNVNCLDSRLVMEVARNDTDVNKQSDDTFCTESKQVSIELVSYNKEVENSSSSWLVSSAKALQGCQICSSPHCKQLNPKIEVATQIGNTTDNEYNIIPKPLDQGRIFCFLPLPITIDQKFLINGQFIVSKDRRHLEDLEEKSLTSVSDKSWNRLLIREVAPQAVLQLIHKLTTVISFSLDDDVADNTLQEYYSIWPLRKPTHPLSEELGTVFPHMALAYDNPIVWSMCEGGKWLPLKAVKTLERTFTSKVFGEAQKDILDVLVQCDYKMAVIPTHLLQVLEESLQKSFTASIVTVVEYVIDVLLPNLTEIEDDLRIRQVLFLLKHYDTLNDICTSDRSNDGLPWLKGPLQAERCIPCQPDGQLSIPQDLVFPNNTFSTLFTVEEGRFPLANFSDNEAAKSTLLKLGMCDKYLRTQDVIDRAHHASKVSEDDVFRYCSVFSDYLVSEHSNKMENVQLIKELAQFPFFPLFLRPNHLTLPWHNTKNVVAKPIEVYQPKYLSLVFSFGMIPDRKVIGEKCLALFFQHMKHEPSITEVQGHLLTIVKWAADSGKDDTFPEVDTIFLNKHMIRIYSHIENFLNCDEEESFKEAVIKPLKNQPFLWVNERFHKPSQCVQSCHFDYYPYLAVAKLDCRNLLTEAGVEYFLTAGKAKVILKQIADDYTESPVAVELIFFTRELVSVIAKSRNTLHYAESEEGSRSGPYYLPDGNRVMRPAAELVCKEWDDPKKTLIQKKLVAICPSGTNYLHVSIPKSEASKLGVVDVLSYVLELLSEDDFDSDDEFEQHEPLTIRLNSLLKQYKGDMTIFKEFIQNADDAKATEIAFILDHRCNFGTESLIDQTATATHWSELQRVPSLLVYNNHRFTDEDIKGITQLGKGSKDGVSNKIGRFGVGFNVAYHVTDCPMFLSFGKEGKAENFCVFDPNKCFLPRQLGRKRKTGKRINFNKVKNAFSAFADQFEPFLQNKMIALRETIPTGFEDHSNGYVVFRLPLNRHQASEYTMDLTFGEKMTVEKLTRLIAGFKEHTSSMLLFLNHLKRISFVEMKRDGTVGHSWTVSVSNSTDYSKQRNFTELYNEALAEVKEKKGESTKVVQEVFDVDIEKRESSLAEPVSCKWLVSKRFGGTDVNKDLLKDTYEKVHLIPVVGVAAPVTRHTHRGKLFCSLPLPHETSSPFHIHGHFSIDPSRQYIDDNSWNRSLIVDIVSRAYVSLLDHARCVVEASGEESHVKWFYKLFLLADYEPPLNFLKELPKAAYQFLIKDKAPILLSSNEKSRCWFSLTDEDKHVNKGWFCHANPALVDVLTSIGVQLTLAPDELRNTVTKFVPSYQGRVTPALVRAALRTITHSYINYWEYIIPNIAELLEFVIEDLTKSNIHEVNGLPLMLTKSGSFKKIQLDNPLLTLEYIDLFDASHVGDVFVHDDLCIVRLHSLGLVVDVNPMFVADHIKSCIVRDKEVVFNRKIRRCLHLLWRFILTHCKNEQVEKVFNHLAVLPTSQGTLVPLLHLPFVLNNYGQHDAVLTALKIPTVDFSLIFSKEQIIKTFESYLGSSLGNGANPNSVLLALVDTLRKHSELYQMFVPPNKAEVMKFILFIQGSTHVTQYQKELRKLCIFQSINGNWTNTCTKQTVYAVKKSTTTLNGVECLENRVHIVLLYEECEIFFQNVGITVLDCKTFYKSIIIPHFEHIPANSRIHHLKAIENMDDKEDLFLLLQSKDFIEHFQQQSAFLRPSVLFDPKVALFKSFLEQKRFPPSPWDTPDVLIILRKLGLIVEADMNRIVNFAQIVSQECSANDTRTKALIHEVKRRIREATCQNAEPENWRNLLELFANIKLICFLPSYYPADLRHAFQCTKAICTFARADELVCFKGSILCPTQYSSLICLCHPVINESLIMTTQLGEERRNNLLSVLGAIPIFPELVARNLLKLTELVGTCTLSSDSTASIKCFQKVFKAHYVYLSTNPLEKDSPQVAELKKASCIFVPSVSGNSLKLVQGCKLVERVAHENRAYSQYISPIPDYLNDHGIKHFRESVGIERTLSAAHFVSFFNDIKEELCQNNEVFYKDRNLEQAVQDGYHDFIALLQSNDYNATAYVETVLTHDGVIYLPSDTGEMLPSTDLVLCDDKWLRDTIPKESHPKFILPPLSTTLPPCLKIQTLRALVTEKLDIGLLEDRYNLCDKELYAEQNNLEHACEDVVALEKLLLSEEFGTGLLRIMSNKRPLTTEQRECVRRVQNLRIVCVRNIETKLSYKGNSFPGTNEVALVDDTSNSLYVCFHGNGGAEDPQVQEEITLQLYKKVIDSFILDSSHLRAIIKQLANPSKIEAALDRLHIAHYKPESTQNTGILGERNVVINDDFELLVLCNFRKNEHVKYCDSDGIVKVAMVVDIPQIPEESGSQLPPMPPQLNLVTTGQDIKKSISCLLICKYITAKQRKVIKSRLTSAISVDSSSNASDEKVVLLKLPMDGENLLQYIQDVLGSFSDNVCKYFAIERLLFQLHYWCVIEEKSAKNMASLIDKFLHCVLTMCQLDQGDEDNKEFLRNLVRKADAMLGRNQPTIPVSTTEGGPQPIVSNVPTGGDEAFSYTSYSSWSASQNIQGLQCSSYWSTPRTVVGSRPSRGNVVSSRPPQSAALLPAHQSEEEETRENAESEPTTSISEAVMWLQQACCDLELAKYLMPGHENKDQEEINCNYPEAVCFYAHEVVEKALKAVYLSYCGLKQELASSHHIVDLCERLKVHPDCPQPINETSTQSHVFFVSRHGNCCRFPDCNLPPAPPMLTHSKTTAREVLSAAIRFLGIVATFEKFADLFPSGELDRIVIPNTDTGMINNITHCMHIVVEY